MKLQAMGLAMLLLFSATCHSQEITLLTEDYKPFQYENQRGQIVGFGVDLIRRMFKDAKLPIKGDIVYLYPWARAYETALTKKDTAVFMTVRNDEREPLFKWVGPLAPREMWLYKLKQRTDIQLDTLEDAKKYRIGGYNKSADTTYMLELGFNVEIIPHQSLITAMLVKGHVELISSLELTMAARLNDLGLPYDAVEKAILLDGRYDYYLALHAETPDSVVHALQASLDSIRADGTYDQLWTDYTSLLPQPQE